ncbi:type IVB secretion system protein IcmH/DotU [Novosphingobium aquimarinum]|uniref:type IVB secretion system protein IcmH/DotU n=1 Tax=Novosphingobium aquimarinum TaxID=2682494 RepID=UPI001E5DD88F|nr:type IVB secretion system protein IcmH/DotU [Novosphingobium aquimarinum]
MSNGNDESGPPDRNKTVFRPSPLQNARNAKSGTAQPAPPPSPGGWGSPPQPPPPPAPATGGWGSPPGGSPSQPAPPPPSPQTPASPPPAPGQNPWGAPPPPPGPSSGWGAPQPSPADNQWGNASQRAGFEQAPDPDTFGRQPAPQSNPWNAPAAPPQAPAGRPDQPPPGMAPSRLGDDDVPLPDEPRVVRNVILDEALPALSLAASIRAGRVRAPMQQFHREVTAAIARFERAIMASTRHTEEQKQRAKYAVCATIDDIAQNLAYSTTDGAEWARRSMVVQFFRENIGGDRFWQLVDDLLRSPRENYDLIELFHACIAAGFEGRFRRMPDGRQRLQEIMTRLNGALDHVRSLSMTELSPRWRGENAPASRINFWNYVLLGLAAAAGFLLLVYIVLRLILMFSGDAPWDRLGGINEGDPLSLSREASALPPEGPSAQAAGLRRFLAPEIEQGLVKVEEDSQTVRVRTTVGQLFESGSDQLEPGREALFRRIGQAIEQDKSGFVTVEGHSDSDKISGNLAFPDNMALSEARAETVAKILRDEITRVERIEPKGFGETRPVASNANAEGKSLNRRVEVVVPRRSNEGVQ